MRATIYILLVFGRWVSSDTVGEKCTRPMINATERSLYIYRMTDLIDVQVYNCQYFEENTYDVCKGTIHQYKDETLLQSSYNDFTQSCIDAFKRNKYIDKYGYPYHLIKNRVHNTLTQYDCTEPDGRQLLNKNISITLNSCTAKADLVRDRIRLRSGTVCKYSSRFCYDPRESVEVTWDVNEQNSTFCSRHFLKVPYNASTSYYLTLDQKYLIFENNSEYMALELRKESIAECGVIIWKTNLPEIIVSEGVIIQALESYIPLKMEDYGVFYFTEKQSLYDFLINKCFTNWSSLSNYELAYELLKKDVAIRQGAAQTQTFLTELEEQRNSLGNLKAKVDDLQRWLIGLLAMVAISVLFIVKNVIDFLFKMTTKSCAVSNMKNDGYKCWVKRFLLGKQQYEDVKIKTVTERVNVGEIRNSYGYETITSEYDFNTLYRRDNPENT